MENRGWEREVTWSYTAVSYRITAVRIIYELFYGGAILYVFLARICTAVRIMG